MGAFGSIAIGGVTITPNMSAAQLSAAVASAKGMIETSEQSIVSHYVGLISLGGLSCPSIQDLTAFWGIVSAKYGQDCLGAAMDLGMLSHESVYMPQGEGIGQDRGSLGGNLEPPGTSHWGVFQALQSVQTIDHPGNPFEGKIWSYGGKGQDFASAWFNQYKDTHPNAGTIVGGALLVVGGAVGSAVGVPGAGAASAAGAGLIVGQVSGPSVNQKITSATGAPTPYQAVHAIAGAVAGAVAPGHVAGGFLMLFAALAALVLLEVNK